jgi:hypothetical protein
MQEGTYGNVQNGTYGSPGRIIWLGLIADLAFALAISITTIWVWSKIRNS